MADNGQEIELVFEPQDEGGNHVYAPDLPGLHTQGDDLDDGMASASESVALYIEGLREDGEPLDSGVIRRTIFPAGMSPRQQVGPGERLIGASQGTAGRHVRR